MSTLSPISRDLNLTESSFKMLNSLKDKSQREQEQVLASITQYLLPKPTLEPSHLTQVEQLTLSEIFEKLKADPNNPSPKVRSRIFKFLADEMVKPIRESHRWNQARFRLEQSGNLRPDLDKIGFMWNDSRSDAYQIWKSHIEEDSRSRWNELSPGLKVAPRARTVVEIASEIVQTQVSSAPMSATEITSLLRQVFGTLMELQKAESGEIELLPAQKPAAIQKKTPGSITPENSIQNDKVVCLECGAEMKQLTQKHLTSHGITPREYKKKYGFPMRTPLAAKSLTRARSKAAEKRRLPANLVEAIKARRQSKAQSVASGSQGKKPLAVKRRRKRKSILEG